MAAPAVVSMDGMELTSCPQCALPAEITERFVLLSTAGPVAHVTAYCIDRHRFTMPAAGPFVQGGCYGAARGSG